MSDHAAPELANRSLRRGLLLGLASGLAAITCCVSPIVLVLPRCGDRRRGGHALGTPCITTTAGTFGEPDSASRPWPSSCFCAIAGCATWRGAFRYRRMLIVLVASGTATYAGLFWFTKYLGIWFG